LAPDSEVVFDQTGHAGDAMAHAMVRWREWLYNRYLLQFSNSNNSNSHNNVYGAVIVAMNCHCESSPGSYGQSSTSARQLPTFGPDQSI